MLEFNKIVLVCLGMNKFAQSQNELYKTVIFNHLPE